MVKRYQLYIDGRREDATGQRTLASVNPYTGTVWAEIPDANEADVSRAVAAANRAFHEGWRDSPGVLRANLMQRLAALT